MSQKSSPYYFCDHSVKCWPILIIFGNVAAAKIYNWMTYSFLIISTLCINIRDTKNNRDSVCFQCCCLVLPLSCHILAAFQKFVQSMQWSTFILNSLISLLLHNLWKCPMKQIYHSPRKVNDTYNNSQTE